MNNLYLKNNIGDFSFENLLVKWQSFDFEQFLNYIHKKRKEI